MRRHLNRKAKAERIETGKVFSTKTVVRRINVRIGAGALLTILLLAVSLLPPASSALRRTLPPPTYNAKTVILGPPLLLKRSLNYLGVSSDDHITPLSPDVAETFDVLPGPVCNTLAPKTVFLLGETVCGRISSLG